MPQAYVIGLGKSGIASARLLKREGWDVVVSDRTTSTSLNDVQAALADEGIEVKLGHTFEPNSQMHRVVVSPGVPWDAAPIVKARELNIDVMGEMELAWRSLKTIPWVGVTGTNGKTTTTALIAAIFQQAGFDAPACGNIGLAACEIALSPSRPDWIIAEISSYQIESSSTLAPMISVWTTFTPDHLNRHYTLENYFNIKARLLQQSQQQVINGDDPVLRQKASLWPTACWTSTRGRADLPQQRTAAAYIENGWAVFEGQPIVPVDALRMVGRHNQQNLLMAIATACLANISAEAIAQAVRDFPGVAHRLEQVGTWGGVQFINDSKATNYDAAEVGLLAVDYPALLIAGGEAKTGDDLAWIRAIRERTKTVLLIGSAAPAFAQRLHESNYEAVEVVETMERAVARSAELAQQMGVRIVLLSPACASFDQYQNFEQRGDHFRQLCFDLLGQPDAAIN